jgi:hypothetical protein
MPYQYKAISEGKRLDSLDDGFRMLLPVGRAGYRGVSERGDYSLKALSPKLNSDRLPGKRANKGAMDQDKGSHKIKGKFCFSAV